MVKLLDIFRHSGLCLGQLFQETSEQVVEFLLILPAEVAIDVCNPDILFAMVLVGELVDDNSGKNRLAGARDSWTEECLVLGLLPRSELC